MTTNKQVLKLQKALNALEDTVHTQEFKSTVPYDLLDELYKLENELHKVKKAIAERQVEKHYQAVAFKTMEEAQKGFTCDSLKKSKTFKNRRSAENFANKMYEVYYKDNEDLTVLIKEITWNPQSNEIDIRTITTYHA